MDLYRILSIEAFVGLLINQQERYVRPCKWEDVYESYLLEELNTADGRKKLVEKLYTDVCMNNSQATIRNFMKLWRAKWYVYAQCWSTTKDSDALWRIYSYGKHSIQICSSNNRILSMIETANILIDKPIAKKVKYDVDDKTDVFREQIKDLRTTKNALEPYFHKRKAFEHEKEYRILLNLTDKNIIEELGTTAAIQDIITAIVKNEEILTSLIDTIERRIYKYNEKRKEVQDSLFVPVHNMKDYVLDVRVNPFAEDWYVDLVRALCNKYSIPFSGKSELYIRK